MRDLDCIFVLFIVTYLFFLFFFPILDCWRSWELDIQSSFQRKLVLKVAWRFCNMCLQTSLICCCFTETSAGLPLMCVTFIVPVVLHRQAWSGPDTRWWLSQGTGTCFVSTSSWALQEALSSTGSGGLWVIYIWLWLLVLSYLSEPF